jgi:hypothetical protein
MTVTLKNRDGAASGLTLRYQDLTHSLRAKTNADGVAVFMVRSDPGRMLVPDSLRLESRDFVLTNLRGSHFTWSADVVHSATWLLRAKPRVCDEWIRVMDIPRGALQTQTAEVWEEWYRSLAPELLANCETLARMEKQVGSKAPWYFYEFKAMPEACVDGKYGPELDWTAWYRGLLEEATGASPGKCLGDWERWWAGKGYPPIPSQPAE